MLYDDNTQDIKLRLVMIVSFKWSFELASINKLLCFLYKVFVYKNNENLTIIVTIHTTISQIEKVYLLP